MKTVKILLGVFVAMLTTASGVQAAKIQAAKLTQSNSTQQATSVQHKLTMTLASTTALKQFRVDYCNRASTSYAGVVGGCDTPEGLVTSGTDKGDLADWSNMGAGGTPGQASWTKADTTGYTVIEHATTLDPTGQLTVSYELGALTNPKIDATDNTKECSFPDGQVAASSPSATCYMRITTFSDAGSTAVDTTTITYTVVAGVTVSATVDPTFQFTIQGVNSATVADGITTSVTSAYNTLPFGNLTAGTVKYAAHRLFVKTNTQSGYSVTSRLTSAITGVYGGDVDLFGYGTGATWGAGEDWTDPSGGTPNTDTAWFGAHIQDTVGGGGGPSGAGKFCGVTTTAVTVKDNATSDNGVTGHYVVYAMEANVYQPADTYQGTLAYNALPTY